MEFNRRKLLGLSTMLFALPVSQLFAQETSEAEVDTEAEEDKAEIVIEDRVLGDENAPVSLIEYASFTCPHCRDFHKNVLPEFRKDYIDTGKVKVIYREVYFDRPGLWASMVARCANPDQYFGMVDLLYSRQADWSHQETAEGIVTELKKIAAFAGLKPEDVDACLNDGDQALALVEWYQTNRDADNITGTPTIFLEGKSLGNPTSEELKEAIDKALGE